MTTMTYADGVAVGVGDQCRHSGRHYDIVDVKRVRATVRDDTGRRKIVGADWLASAYYVTAYESLTLPKRPVGLVPGSVVTLRGQPGLWVCLKWQDKTSRWDIAQLGGGDGTRFRASVLSLEPVNEINDKEM